MADNTTLPGTGDVIADEDIGGVKHQLVKVEYGAAGTATKVDAATGLPVASGYKEVTGTATANSTDLVSLDVSAYRWIQLHFTGTWSATAAFQFSNDNANWVNAYLARVDLGSPLTWTNSNFSSNTMWSGPVQARYFRVRTSSYTSGTVTVVAGFNAHPGTPSRLPLDGATVNVAGAASTANADAISASTLSLSTVAFLDVFNGTTWDRARSFGTTGAVGVTPTPGTTGGWSVSSQTALSNTKTQVKASAGTVGGYIVHNPNASTVWVQVFDVANASITVGTTAPTWTIGIPAGSTADLEMTCGVNHATAINVAATTTATGSTAPTTAVTATIFYK